MVRSEVRRLACALVAVGALAGCSGAELSLDDAGKVAGPAVTAWRTEHAARAEDHDAASLAAAAEEERAREARTVARAAALLDGAEHAAAEVFATSAEEAATIAQVPAHGRTEQLGEPGVVEIGNWNPPVDPAAASQPTIDDVYPTKGAVKGGEKVVIRGNNLDAAQVVFGATPARMLKVTADAITVAAPAEEAGTVTIVVTSRSG